MKKRLLYIYLAKILDYVENNPVGKNNQLLWFRKLYQIGYYAD